MHIDIKKEIEKRSKSYLIEDDYKVFKQIYTYLSNKEKLIGIEYSFLCWLNYRFNWELKINTPKIPIIKELAFLEIYNKFLFNEHRLNLFLILIEYIRSNRIDINILIGGSFIDKENIYPNDIDVIFLISEKIATYECMEENNILPRGIELCYLPINYCLHKFRAYYHITALGNIADKKEKIISQEGIENNTFKEREIVKYYLKLK